MTNQYEHITYYKCNPNAFEPEFATKGSACFDLKACLDGIESVKVYDTCNVPHDRHLSIMLDVTLYPNERMLVPTGLIFDLYPDQSIRIHPRSGLSLKNGITLGNCEAVIDSDYVNETYIMLANVSSVPFKIEHGMRIAQGEIVLTRLTFFEETVNKPEKKQDREGGLGSTGV